MILIINISTINTIVLYNNKNNVRMQKFINNYVEFVEDYLITPSIILYNWLNFQPIPLIRLLTRNMFNGSNYNIEQIKQKYYLGLIDTGSIDITAFIFCCENNLFECAKWIYSLNNNPNFIHSYDEKSFRYCCRYGNLEMAKWLLSVGIESNNPIDIHACDDESFISACSNNHKKTAQWLYTLGYYNIHIKNECIFRDICRTGDIELCKWFYSLGFIDQNGIININARNDNAFFTCCLYGHFEIAKWLYSLQFETYHNLIDIRADHDVHFELVCSNGKIDMIEWLESICPEYDHYYLDMRNKFVPLIKDTYEAIKFKISKTLKEKNTVSDFYFKNKILKQMNPCIVCMEDSKYFVQMSCNHLICINCFLQIDKCYYRCKIDFEKFSDHVLIESESESKSDHDQKN